jgi:hypothetical protein
VTDCNRPFSFTGALGFQSTFTQGVIQGRTKGYWNIKSVLRPHERLGMELSLRWSFNNPEPRFVGQSGNSWLFGELDSSFLTAMLTQTWVIAPQLTLQTKAQLQSGYGRYGPFYQTPAVPRRLLQLDELSQASALLDPSFHFAELVVNVTLRWEYRLGSTLYVVYSHKQDQLPALPGVPPRADVYPDQLVSGPAQDQLMVKWCYLFNL